MLEPIFFGEFSNYIPIAKITPRTEKMELNFTAMAPSNPSLHTAMNFLT